MTPAAPGLFSTITVTSSRLASGTASARAMTSLLPPGANGTTIWISLGSASCADATVVKPAQATMQRTNRASGRRMRALLDEHLRKAIVSRPRRARPRNRSVMMFAPLEDKRRALATHHLPQRSPGIRADARRELQDRRGRASRLHRRRFRQRRRRADPARVRYVDKPARVA